MQEAQQKVRLHDLARAIIYAQTASEKKSNEQASQLMSGDAQDELVSNIYSRIAQKKPHIVSQLYYLGKSSYQTADEPAESTGDGDESVQSQHELQNEIVLTQITQVAYSLRQNKRAFDTACMLELLCKDFLSRKFCIEPSRDLSKSPSDEFRPSLFQMTQNAKIVQLLLALSKNPSDTHEKSEFVKNYLKRKIRLNEDQHLLVKPHLAEYLQSDCQEIERDKTIAGRNTYLSYDTKSFHNPLFKHIEVKPIHGAAPYRLQNLTEDVNRFNCDLVRETMKTRENLETHHGYRVGVSASDGNYPAPLLGATLRSLDQATKTNYGNGGLFGAGETSISAFGMTLQIPQLPPIDQRAIFNEDGSIDAAQVVPTFSFFQPCQIEDEKTKIEAPASKTKARLTIVAQNSNPNKRQQKQDYKKNKREVSVWSLLPYVNEKLLDHNMAEESGIQRMWEDESIHLHMRNLSVCEPGVITPQKEASFRACFKASVGSVIRVPGSSKTIKEKDLVRSLILVLQGIPSQQVFELEKTTFTFNTNPNLTISDLCCTSASLQELCSEFAQAGCYFLHLREFSEFMSSHNVQAGQVVEAFALSIQDFLIFYQHQVNELERKAEACRQDNGKAFQDTSNVEKLDQKFVSLLEIKVLMAPLLAQIQTIASICFTTKFIRDIQTQQQLKKVGGGSSSPNQSLDEPNDEFKFMSLLFQRNALTAANLKEQMEENLEKIRSEQWLNEFPKGARLLTYLYRIMLASEADLQVIDLLRQIFSQSVRPILLMISAFITIGSFEDPFKEFFVEKLYRTALSKAKPSADGDFAKFAGSTDDYVFKITSDTEKIPVFLNDTAVTIFKIGCDLNLLKTKRQQILTEKQQSSAISTPMNSKATATRVNLPDYFAICAQGHLVNAESNHYSTRLRMVDQASRVLTLDFQVETLQRKHLMDSRLFEHQSNLLQKIEQQIAQEETDALLQMISLREKAAIFKATEFEKNRLRVARIKDEEKRKYMQQIEEQIKERKQNREAIQLVELQERQRIEQEQLEYKQMQKEIAENLRSQLMELLKANQSIADTRTDDAIQKEALEHQLSELEQKAERAKQEVQQEQKIVTSTDQEMKDESLLKPDEEAMLVDSKPHVATIEPAGKASTTQKGGLARLLFGKGEPDLEEQKNKQQMVNGSSDQKQNYEEIKLDDIQIDLTDEEKKLLVENKTVTNPEINEEPKQIEETDKEKVEFIRKVFLKPLLSRVFKFVDEKQAMDSKRKTWNLKHQVSQVEDFRRQKKNWEYRPTQEKSLRERMDALFKEHQNESRALEETKPVMEPIRTEETPVDEMFKVPVSLAIQQSIIHVVNHQHKLVNKCLLHMMHRGMFLLRHFEYLKMVFLASQGDVFASFHESVFNEDFQQTAKDSSLQFLNMQLELAVRSSRPECNYRTGYEQLKNDQSGAQNIAKPIELGVNLAQLISEDGTELTKFRFVPTGRSSQLDINPNFFFTISNIGEFVRLDYSTEHPLDRVISQQCMNKYNTLFFFLLKLKRTNYCLTLIWKELNGVEFRRISAADFRQLRKLQFLWQQMQYFLKTIDEYVMVAVIHSQWTILKKQLAQIDYFEELISLHNSYLDTILEKCFLARARDNRLQITLNQIFEFVFKLHFLVRSHGVDITRDYSAKQELQNISVQFRDYSRFLYQIVRNLAQKGQFKELFIRLDFNKFYQNSAGGSGAPTLTVSRNIIQQ